MSSSLAMDTARLPGNHHAEHNRDADLSRLQREIEHAAHLLPAQGPITVFIHHNTLHAFEELNFFDAVKQGSRIFGCQPYLTEDRYREELNRGRIQFRDLQTVLDEDLGVGGDHVVAGIVRRADLQLAMLQFPLRYGSTEELLWFIAETDALRRVRGDVSAAMRNRLLAETRHWTMRDLRMGENGRTHKTAPGQTENIRRVLDRFNEKTIESWTEDAWEAFSLQILWVVCREGAAQARQHEPRYAPPPHPIRHRDLLLRAAAVDSDRPVNELLIRFCAAYLDQGFAPVPLPHREEGMLRAFSLLYGEPGGTPDVWLSGLHRELARIEMEQLGALNSIHESLEHLGVPGEEWGPFLSATLLALPGWAGMVAQVEERGDRVARPIASGSLLDFLAIRLLLDRLSLQHAARESLGFTGPLRELRAFLTRRVEKPIQPSDDQRAFLVFQLAQVLGLTPSVLSRLSVDLWANLFGEIEAFSALERRRLFHLAYERRFVTRALDIVALRPRYTGGSKETPRFQLITCLDEREESFRRHLEEVAPDCETFGAAGFFGVAMYFRGVADAHFVPLCPIVLVPQHWVSEQVEDAHAETNERRARARRVLGAASHHFHVGSRGFALGALLTACLGVIASIPLVARVLFPRLTARIRKIFGRFVQASPATRLKLERSDPSPGTQNGHLGYTLQEMADLAERQLRDIGLTKNLARLVFFIGHGSISVNNPHKSAYDCGACGGSPGAPNGRALAHMLNDPRVREVLRQRGLAIPADTVFVGGFHNTCDDSVSLYDLERVPETHHEDLARVRRDIEETLDRNAHERCRRFMSAPLTLSPPAARQHVEGRSADLAQTRPELGHATNAICFVGRRERNRGLYFDRRAFLTSYDPTQDDADATTLTRLLSAAVPVCAGINLEYYFSRVDSAGWGCGTKLPHNVASLLGVMDGAASDLRTGLPWQMVEIHEPVRLLFIIETRPETMLMVMERNPGIGRIFRNGWALLALQDPSGDLVQVYRDGSFSSYVPEATDIPRAPSSVDWYRGWRDHLEFARIGD